MFLITYTDEQDREWCTPRTVYRFFLGVLYFPNAVNVTQFTTMKRKSPSFHAPTATKLTKAKRLKLPAAQPSVEMMNEWSYTSTTPYVLTVCTRTSLPLSYNLPSVYDTRFDIYTGRPVVL
jgi:hypothetical protein